MVTPLIKRKLDGEVYTRDKGIEALLAELEKLPRSDLVVRCRISLHSDPNYVPSECLLYFVRASRADSSDAHFERLYKILIERVLRALPKAEIIKDGRALVSLTDSKIRDSAVGRFVELVAADRSVYSEKLDYFEVRFAGALASLRLDAQRKARREEERTAPLEYGADTNELSPEVERAAGSFELSNSLGLDAIDFRSCLAAAINALPPEQKRIVEMIDQGFPIDSKEPDVMTIAKALGRSEKTIRTYRDRAYNTLRVALSSGEDQ